MRTKRLTSRSSIIIISEKLHDLILHIEDNAKFDYLKKTLVGKILCLVLDWATYHINSRY